MSRCTQLSCARSRAIQSSHSPARIGWWPSATTHAVGNWPDPMQAGTLP